MLILLATLVAAACVAASARRLAIALGPTPLDLTLLEEEVRGEQGRARAVALAPALATVPGADWERALFAACEQPGELGQGAVNEQLLDFDARLSRWSRVPRVCASVASSVGLLLATLALRDGLSVAVDLPMPLRDAAVGAAVASAINVVAIGVAAATFCGAAHLRAGKAARERALAAGRLAERLLEEPPKFV